MLTLTGLPKPSFFPLTGQIAGFIAEPEKAGRIAAFLDLQSRKDASQVIL
jgi:hypothetical protein